MTGFHPVRVGFESHYLLMTKPKVLSRYSGNKARLLKHYGIPAAEVYAASGIKRIVEPYFGSGAFSMNVDLPALGFEVNPLLVAMYDWLRESSPEELEALRARVDEIRKSKEKPDVRELELPEGPQTYVRLNVCSAMVGQLSSWKMYPQHKLPIENTIRCLPRLQHINVILSPASTYKYEDGDLCFIDPPYVGTKANYLGRKENIERLYKPEDTVSLISGISGPIIFTYGTNAKEVFPQYDWEPVLVKKVANIRKGGTITRIEHVAYINW